MPKRNTDFPIHLNMMVADDGTKEELRAIAYFRDGSGEAGPVARDFIRDGIEKFKRSLSEADRKRLREILENVRVMRAMKKGQGSATR